MNREERVVDAAMISVYRLTRGGELPGTSGEKIAEFINKNKLMELSEDAFVDFRERMMLEVQMTTAPGGSA